LSFRCSVEWKEVVYWRNRQDAECSTHRNGSTDRY